MERSTTGPTRMRNALSAFLESHLGGTYRDDVGPLLGQASVIREHGYAGATPRRWHEAVNVAVSSEASRERLPQRRAGSRRAAGAR
jgi:hypothetical protein